MSDIKTNLEKDNSLPIDTYHGKTSIAPDVLFTITQLATLSVPGVIRMSSVPGGINRLFQRGVEGVQLQVKGDVVSVDLYIVIEHDVSIRELSQKVQAQVARAISEMVGMKVGHVNIHIEDVDFPVETEA